MFERFNIYHDCIEFIVCEGRNISIIEYNISDDECEWNHKKTFRFRDENVYYNVSCGICVLESQNGHVHKTLEEKEFKSNVDDPDDIEISSNINYNHTKKYHIILFGNGFDDVDKDHNFVSSLQWLSLDIVRDDDNNISYNISIDNEKTKQFQNTFVDLDNEFGNGKYHSFGYLKWKHYLILFGGSVKIRKIDSIFYFNFHEMKWYKSFKVL